MLIYFTNKLNTLNSKIERIKSDIIRYATELDIKAIIETTSNLSKYKEKLEEITKDCTLYLTVPEIIQLLKESKISERTVAYIYKYEKSVTLQERDLLTKISWDFKDIKVK